MSSPKNNSPHTNGGLKTVEMPQDLDFFRRVIDSLDRHAVYSITKDGNIHSWSAGAQSIFGYREDEIIGKPSRMLYAPENAAQGEAERQRALASEKGRASAEAWYLRKDGQHFLGSGVTYSFREKGVVCGYVKIVRDLTDIQLRRKKLDDLTMKLMLAIDFMPALIAFTDKNRRYVFANKSYTDWFGYPAEQIRGMSQKEILDPQAYESVRPHIEAALSGQEVHFEAQFLNKKGERRWGMGNYIPYRDETGAVTGFFILGIDITERKQLEQKLHQAKKEAEEASQAKSRFLASISHELRTPLNSIIGFTDLLLKHDVESENTREFLNRIAANSRDLLNLVNEVLDLSRVESGRIELHWEELDLERFVSDTVAQMRGHLRTQEVTLSAEIPKGLRPIKTDRERLKQILINLIGNAIKFTDRGSIKVRVLADAGGQAPERIEVSDTGIGIPQDKLNAIFEPFLQLDPSATKRPKGSGLGLAISKSICDLLGYQMEVASAIGQGSTFNILLSSDGRRGGIYIPPKALPAAHPRLTLVDDNQDTRLLVRCILDGHYKVDEYDSGTKALEKMRASRPNLVLLDISLPGIDGLEVLSRMRSDPALRDIPVIAFTAFAMEGDREKYLSMGFDGYVSKPITDASQFLETLNKTLGRFDFSGEFSKKAEPFIKS